MENTPQTDFENNSIIAHNGTNIVNGTYSAPGETTQFDPRIPDVPDQSKSYTLNFTGGQYVWVEV